jgi:hypothetical protein
LGCRRTVREEPRQKRKGYPAHYLVIVATSFEYHVVSATWIFI